MSEIYIELSDVCVPLVSVHIDIWVYILILEKKDENETKSETANV